MKFKLETLLKLLMTTIVAFFLSIACFYWSGQNYSVHDFIETHKNKTQQKLEAINIPVDFKNITRLTVATNVTDVVIKKAVTGKIELTDSSANSSNMKVINDHDNLSIDYNLHDLDNSYAGKLTVFIPDAVKNVVINTTNGDVDVTSALELKKLSINVTSGDLTINNITADNISLRSTNGNIKYAGVTPKLKAQTVNGDMNIISNKKQDKVFYDLKTVSGDVILKLPKDMTAKINTLTVNGDVSTNSAQYNKDSKSIINITTVNGDIDVGVQSESE